MSFVNIFNNQNVVLNLEGACVKFLAAHVSYAYIKVVAGGGVRNTTDQLWLTVKKN